MRFCKINGRVISWDLLIAEAVILLCEITGSQATKYKKSSLKRGRKVWRDNVRKLKSIDGGTYEPHAESDDVFGEFYWNHDVMGPTRFPEYFLITSHSDAFRFIPETSNFDVLFNCSQCWSRVGCAPYGFRGTSSTNILWNDLPGGYSMKYSIRALWFF